MKILVTGAEGFMGKNLCAALRNIRDGKDQRGRYKSLLPLEVFEYDRNSSADELAHYCEESDFVFHLAGVNRADSLAEFEEGNCSLTSMLLSMLEAVDNRCPVMLSSSIQASLLGRYENGEYGRTKLAGEELVFSHASKTGSPALVYRFPNVFGKWCRPNYNSVVATFCYNVTHGLPIHVDDEDACLDLVYIDDVVSELLEALIGGEHRCNFEGLTIVPSPDGKYCYVPGACRARLGDVASLIEGFRKARTTLEIPNVEDTSLSKNLLSTYLSYLDLTDLSYSLDSFRDERGSFTEIIHTSDRGQVSVNVIKPGVTKGNHWHQSKWEKFCVVSGEGIIKIRRIDDAIAERSEGVVEYHVSGDCPRVVEMIPGCTHSITNVSESVDLITVMWANEIFDVNRPDTYFEEV